jgi:PAS domain S-box-containing protein
MELGDLMKEDNKTKKQLIDELTELRSQYAALKESESAERYRSLVENIRDVIYELDSQGVVLYISPAIRDMLGYDSAEIEGKNFIELAHKDDLSSLAEWFSELRKGKESLSEYRVINKSGEFKWAQTKTRPIIEDGLLKGARGILIDITAQRRTEEALQKSERRLRMIVEHVNDAFYIHDFQGNITDLNDNACRMLGYTREELLAGGLPLIDTPMHSELMPERMSRLIRDGFVVFECQHKRKDGKVVDVNVSAKIVSSDGNGIVQSFVSDITERKLAETALRESERRLREAQEMAQLGYWHWDVGTGNVEWSEEVYNILQLDPNKFTPHIDSILALSPWPDDHERDKELIRRAMEKHEMGVYEQRFLRPDGSIGYYHSTFQGNYDDGGSLISIVGTVQDITERKQAEEVLKESEEKYRQIFETSRDCIFVTSKDGRWIDMNDAAVELFGYSSREELMQVNVLNLYVNPEDRARHINRIAERGYVKEYPVYLRKKDGTAMNTLITTQPTYDTKGDVIKFQGTIRDVTAQRKVEKEQRETEEKYRSLVEGTDLMCLLDRDGFYLLTNERYAQRFGVPRNEIIGRRFADFHSEESTKEFMRMLKDVIKTCASVQHEYRSARDGRYFIRTLSPIKDQDGTIKSVTLVTKDITDRKQAEEALSNSEGRLHSLVQTIPDLIWLKDKDGVYLSCNPMFERFFGAREADIVGKTDYDFVDRELADVFRKHDRKAMAAGQPTSNEEWITFADDGHRALLDVIKTPMYDARGTLVGVLGIGHDSTERKRAEEKLQQTLESLRKAVGTTIQVMVSAVEARDPYTSGHQIRSANLALCIATEMGLPQEKIEGIRMAGSIHDIGKLSIPAEILSKPKKLSEIEFSLIKEHATKGYEMLKDVESPWPLAQIVYQHHERMNGSGYPRNLKGDDILMEARILAVSDVVEAMASHRPYRPGLGIDAALEEIEKNRGTHYDNTVVDACLRLFREKGFKLKST